VKWYNIVRIVSK